MIKIICVGKIKEKYFKEGIIEYQKRLTKYTKLEIIEVKDYDDKDPIVAIEKEKDEIFKHLNLKDYIITLEIVGNELDSISLAKYLDKTLAINPDITFIIGGSNGISDKIKKISNYKLSFSKLTFPHQLFRLILLEQLYRSFKILNNESYHK